MRFTGTHEGESEFLPQIDILPRDTNIQFTLKDDNATSFYYFLAR